MRGKLLEILLEMFKESQTGVYQSTGKVFRKPYFAFVVKLSNLLNNVCEKYNLAMPEIWSNFCQSELKEINAKDTTVLGASQDRGESEFTFSNILSNQEIAQEISESILNDMIDNLEISEPEYWNYASNNYWRKDLGLGLTLKDIENDFK